MPRFGIIDFWKVPLVCVGAWDAEIQEPFLGRIGNPIHTVVYADLCLILASSIIDAEAYSLKLSIIFIIVTTVFDLSFLRSVFFDELRLEICIDLLLSLLSLLFLLVLIIVLPGPTNKVLVTVDVALWIL